MSKYQFIILQPKSSTIPLARSGHRSATDGVFLYVFGGYSPLSHEKLFREIWCFNLSLQTWHKLETVGPSPICVASATLVLKRRKLIVFGGSGYPFGSNSSNKTFICHLNEKQWEEIQCSSGDNSLPIASYGQSAVIGPNNCMYVFGGTRGLDYNNELYKLDLELYSWEHIVCRHPPPARYRHEAIGIDGGFVIFGGYGEHGACSLDKVFVFKYGEKVWQEVTTQPDEHHGYPSPRRAHSSVLYCGYAYVCGGYDEAPSIGVESKVFDDVWKLNLQTFSWYKIEQSLPFPRFFHSAAVTNFGSMYIFGGVVQTSKYIQSRTDQVLQMWLVVPPLLELCWQKVCKIFPVSTEPVKKCLTGLGVPKYLIARLNNEVID